ncbi:MAG: 2-amino-4-hydroxy-6-hydroxymethyldihydropteridine diphosphokinase [Bacteroidetes bacterium]|nr:MAG: 2-amino-4-hydroxy-6-hydroxymethyldihydropteridine diphosphokinase [Bacteroidota bacterium]
MIQVFLSLGSNKGDRLRQLKKSVEHIQHYAGNLITISDIFESKSWAYEDTDYLNAVIKIQSNLSPEELLSETQKIEKELGRSSKTNTKNGKPVYSSRIIDIDILFYGNKIINSEHLTIPHSLLHLRRFVLQPMIQIAPDFIHPVFNETIETLYIRCEDENSVKLFKKVHAENFRLP